MQVGRVLFARGAVLIPKCPVYKALSGYRKWLPQVTFRKTVCCRGHRSQGPVSMSPAAGDRRPEHPSRRRAAQVRCCCSGHHALGPGHPSRPLGHPHFSVAALMNSCLQLSGLQIPEKECGSLSPSSTSGMCWLGLTLRWATSLPQAPPSEGCWEAGFRASHTQAGSCASGSCPKVPRWKNRQWVVLLDTVYRGCARP